jgi:hypothetical protein
MTAVQRLLSLPNACFVFLSSHPEGRASVDAKKVLDQSAAVLIAVCGDIDRQDNDGATSAY